MQQQSIDALRAYLKRTSGLILDQSKQYLIESRVLPIVKREKLGSLADLALILERGTKPALAKEVIESMTINETYFFRDRAPFDKFRDVVMPKVIAARSNERSLRVWCAASSTGQEPYSLAMLLHEHFPELRTWKVFLLATDLSREVLARAREGKYNQMEVNRGLPAALLVKHFEQRGTHWQLKDEIRGLVDFRELNLAQPWPALPRMDLVLLRNVMIYFDVDMKKDILSRLVRVLRPDGYLLLGGAETTFNLSEAYRRVEPLKAGFYQLVSGR